jgi:hypothetical protein
MLLKLDDVACGSVWEYAIRGHEVYGGREFPCFVCRASIKGCRSLAVTTAQETPRHRACKKSVVWGIRGSEEGQKGVSIYVGARNKRTRVKVSIFQLEEARQLIWEKVR